MLCTVQYCTVVLPQSLPTITVTGRETNINTPKTTALHNTDSLQQSPINECIFSPYWALFPIKCDLWSKTTFHHMLSTSKVVYLWTQDIVWCHTNLTAVVEFAPQEALQYHIQVTALKKYCFYKCNFSTQVALQYDIQVTALKKYCFYKCNISTQEALQYHIQVTALKK